MTRPLVWVDAFTTEPFAGNPAAVCLLAQRTLSRRREGSANWHKAKRRVARLHARVTDSRRDLQHKLSTRLIRENQAVYLEDLTWSPSAVPTSPTRA